VIATVLGLSPTDISAMNSSVIASISVIESLSGLTATARLPSRETAIDEEECDSISKVCSAAEFADSVVFDEDTVASKVCSVAGLTDSVAFDGENIVGAIVDSVASTSTISKLSLQPTKPQEVSINTITSIDLKYTAK
jgi:hypothetical protein